MSYPDGVTQAHIDAAIQGERCVCGRERNDDGTCDWCLDQVPDDPFWKKVDDLYAELKDREAAQACA